MLYMLYILYIHIYCEPFANPFAKPFVEICAKPFTKPRAKRDATVQHNSSPPHWPPALAALEPGRWRCTAGCHPKAYDTGE